MQRVDTLLRVRCKGTHGFLMKLMSFSDSVVFKGTLLRYDINVYA